MKRPRTESEWDSHLVQYERSHLEVKLLETKLARAKRVSQESNQKSFFHPKRIADRRRFLDSLGAPRNIEDFMYCDWKESSPESFKILFVIHDREPVWVATIGLDNRISRSEFGDWKVTVEDLCVMEDAHWKFGQCPDCKGRNGNSWYDEDTSEYNSEFDD